jgi:AcrR family transcriptional regulator
MTDRVRSPGRPRSPQSHQAIIRATLELLLEGGYGRLTMEAVRTRAGVGKATIYRRWQSKHELVRDAILYLHEDLATPDTGSLRGDYAELARMILASTERSGAATLAPRLLAEAVDNPELHRIFYAHLVEPRRRATRGMLEKAVARGEIRNDVDLELVVDLLAGPVVYRLLITAGDLNSLFGAEQQLDILLAGLAPRQ